MQSELLYNLPVANEVFARSHSRSRIYSLLSLSPGHCEYSFLNSLAGAQFEGRRSHRKEGRNFAYFDRGHMERLCPP